MAPTKTPVKPKDPPDPPDPPKADDVDEPEVVTKGELSTMLDELIDAKLKGLGAPPKVDEPKVDDEPKGRGTLREREDEVARMVKEAVADVKDRDEIIARVKAVEEKVVEQPPTVYRRLTKMLWGGEER